MMKTIHTRCIFSECDQKSAVLSVIYSPFSSFTPVGKKTVFQSSGASLNRPKSPAKEKEPEEVVGRVDRVSGDVLGPALTSGLEEVADGR